MQPWYALDRKRFFEYMSSENHAAPLVRYRFSEGRAKDTEAVELNTGTGLTFTVLPDRCCDVAQLLFKGIPLSWISNLGPAAPAYYNGTGLHWRDTFCGGLLTTCGLETAGPPSNDEGVEFGLHGGIGHVPAQNVRAWGEWLGEVYRMHVMGDMHYAFPLAGHLLLTRHIWTELGANELHVEDQVTNLGAQSAPLMLIYHMNFGYPLVCPDTRFYADASAMQGTSPLAEEHRAEAYVFDAPTADYQARAYTHQMRNRNGEALAALCNEPLGIGVALKFTADTLPRLSLWKNLCSGNYLAALEPMNCPPVGRAKNRAQGTLPMLAPGASQTFGVTVTVLEGARDLQKMKIAFEAQA